MSRQRGEVRESNSSGRIQRGTVGIANRRRNPEPRESESKDAAD